MRKKLSGFFILSKHWAIALLIGLAFSAGYLYGQSSPAKAAAPQPSAAPRSSGFTVSLNQVRVAAPDVHPVPAERAEQRSQAPRAAKTPKAKAVPELVGSVGYAIAGGNCVNEPGINNPGFGNPSDWPVTSQEPTIGATAVFTWNHVGVVTGLWKNGDIEVRHQNYWGGQHRFPRSMMRGYR